MDERATPPPNESWDWNAGYLNLKKSCDLCCARKRRCLRDGRQPCTLCKEKGVVCTYSQKARRGPKPHKRNRDGERVQPGRGEGPPSSRGVGERREERETGASAQRVPERTGSQKAAKTEIPGSPHQDQSRQEHPRLEHPHLDHSRQDLSRQDHPRQDHPRHDHSRQDHPRQDHPRQDYPRHEHPHSKGPRYSDMARHSPPRVPGIPGPSDTRDLNSFLFGACSQVVQEAQLAMAKEHRRQIETLQQELAHVKGELSMATEELEDQHATRKELANVKTELSITKSKLHRLEDMAQAHFERQGESSSRADSRSGRWPYAG